MSLSDWVQQQADEIIAKVDPYSEQNIDETNAAVDNAINNTFVGGVKESVNVGNDISNNLSAASADPKSSITVSTLPVSFYGIPLGGNDIVIDLSWYGPYRTQAHSVISAFLWISYFIIILRALPSILGSSSTLIYSNNDGVAASENIIVNDDGVVLSHTTTLNDSSNHVRVTQRHNT